MLHVSKMYALVLRVLFEKCGYDERIKKGDININCAKEGRGNEESNVILIYLVLVGLMVEK